MERLSDVIGAEPEDGFTDLDQLPLPPVAGEVSFQDIDFSFNEGSPLVVKSVSFDVLRVHL